MIHLLKPLGLCPKRRVSRLVRPTASRRNIQFHLLLWVRPCENPGQAARGSRLWGGLPRQRGLDAPHLSGEALGTPRGGKQGWRSDSSSLGPPGEDGDRGEHEATEAEVEVD